MLHLQDISLSLAGRSLIKPFTLAVKPGEIVTLMGASGSGKSSILSFIGGDLDEAFRASGEIKLNGLRVNDVPPERRGIARLFQDDLLFPHMTIAENLLFALPDMAQSKRLAAMREALLNAGLEGFENRPPHTLSGGQRSRVSLIRALVAKPAAILLDEPFSKLDEDLRQTVRDYTFAQIVACGIPALLVSHDRGDGPKDGRIMLISKTGEVYDV